MEPPVVWVKLRNSTKDSFMVEINKPDANIDDLKRAINAKINVEVEYSTDGQKENGKMSHPVVEIDSVDKIFKHGESIKDLRAVYGPNIYLVDISTGEDILAEGYVLETSHRYQLKRSSTTSAGEEITEIVHHN